jgi:hypothetical protein
MFEALNEAVLKWWEKLPDSEKERIVEAVLGYTLTAEEIKSNVSSGDIMAFYSFKTVLL